MRKIRAILFLLLAAAFCMSPVYSLQEDVALKKKIGQMLLIGFEQAELKPNDPIVQAILNQEIGGVILFDYNFKTKSFEHNIRNPEQLKRLTDQLQAYAKQTAVNNGSQFKPLFISVDYEGGNVNRLNENYGFPRTMPAAQLAKLPFPQAEKYAQQMANTLENEGINMNFAPVLDVNNNPNNPIIGKLDRSFSADVDTVIKYGALFSQAFKKAGVICAYKHFPGHGSSTGDTHISFVDVTHTWKENELTPYQVLFSRDYSCPMVMTAHVVNFRLDPKGLPASISQKITTDLLRHKMHFNGVVITDDLQMKAISQNYDLEKAVRLAINAGADILTFGNQVVTKPQDPKQLVEMIYADVQSGKISRQRIEESYARIMGLKSGLRY